MTDALILNSLEVTNFRAFRRLQINRLGRVNLIVGKNNIGKTCLLEALRLYASRGALETMREILRERNEYAVNADEKTISSLRYLFHGWEDFDDSTDTAIVIGPKNDTHHLYVRIAALYNPYFDRLSCQQFGPDSYIEVFDELAVNGYTNQVPLALGVTIQDSQNANKNDQILIFLTKYKQQMQLFNNELQGVRNFYPIEPIPAQFLSTHGLSPAEVAERLNVQVFATTHSWDSVTAFQQAAQAHDSEGLLISLRPKAGHPGEVVGTLFDEADLEVVATEQIEVR